ncbi:MAG: hypothetical protein ACTSQ8_07785 [Candidatus Helarchaeota archaeon]
MITDRYCDHEWILTTKEIRDEEGFLLRIDEYWYCRKCGSRKEI